MYFKFSYRTNPAKGQSEAYYRLVESYRDETDRVCHRTLLNVGFLDSLVDDAQRERIRCLLNNRCSMSSGQQELFETEQDDSPVVNELVEKLWNELVIKNRIDVGQKPKKEPTFRQRNMVFEESIRHPDVRENRQRMALPSGA